MGVHELRTEGCLQPGLSGSAQPGLCAAWVLCSLGSVLPGFCAAWALCCLGYPPTIGAMLYRNTA